MKNQVLSSEPPKTAEELNQLAKSHIREQRYDEARQNLQASLALERTPAAYRYLGVICRFKKEFPEALKWFAEALKIDAKDHATLCQLAEAYFDMGDLTQATAYYAFAIQSAPSEIGYKERFIGMSARVTFVNYASVVEDAIVDCLKTPGLDWSPIQALWYNTFTLNPAFQPLYKLSGGGLKALVSATAGGAFDKDPFLRAPSYKPFLSPFFLLGMKNITVYSLAFEEFISCLRQSLLAELEAPAHELTRQEYTALAGALAVYSFNTEYIIEYTPEEEKSLDGLCARIEAAANIADVAHAIAIYGCYRPLYPLKNAEQIAATLKDTPEMAAAVKTQITDHFDLWKIRATIPAITPIDDSTSQKVREMYEESPYPKWLAIPKNIYVEKPGKALQKKGAQILVAGCGTGNDAIQYAMLFPEAEVLAIDLSLTSLSYATNKARQYNVGNIAFRQADILQLGALDRKFDCVVSGGVLHHLKDPFRGWQVLTGLVNPGGLMKIGLYSKHARRYLLQAHKIIRDRHPGLDLAGMRAFRKDSAKILGKDLLRAVSRYEDYFHLSMYRDMMFHVQEHDMDLPEIGGLLQKLGLKFVEFSLLKSVLLQYAAAYPGDTDGGTLDHWDAFEKKNSDIFSNCYIFWCQKT